MSLLVKAKKSGRDIVAVTPASAGWRYVGFAAHRLAAGESVQAKRVAMYKKAQEMLLEQNVAILPLFQDALNVLVSPNAKGVELNAMDHLHLKNVRME